MAGSPKKRQRREEAAKRAAGLAPVVFSDGVGDTAATVEDVLSRPMRRISYSEELAEQICVLIALRVPLARICQQDWAPCERTLFAWRREHKEFDEMIAIARVHRAEARVDRIDEISAKVERGLLDPIAGRMLFDAERWIAGRENPSRYSENATPQRVELTGPNGTPLHSDDPREIARFYALIFARGAEAEDAIELAPAEYETLPAPAR